MFVPIWIFAVTVAIGVLFVWPQLRMGLFGIAADLFEMVPWSLRGLGYLFQLGGYLVAPLVLIGAAPRPLYEWVAASDKGDPAQGTAVIGSVAMVCWLAMSIAITVKRRSQAKARADQGPAA